MARRRPAPRLALVGLVCLAAALARAGAAASALAELRAAADTLSPWLVSLRRDLHRMPELMFEEHNTSARIRSELEAMGIPVAGPFAKTGLVGRIGSGSPVVALRADIDALPIQEPEGLAYRSEHPGRMHACGHDAHMTMLLGAARLLKEREAQLPGSVLLVFQPAEEGGAGADVMIRAGAIEGASAAFGMHVMPFLPTGQLATRSGTIMAGSLTFAFNITGRGGHAALPHLNIDPVPAAAAVITALQTLVSRETSPLGSAVLSVTQLQGSDADNVIPNSVILRGTLRALSHDHMVAMQRRIEEMVAGVAASYRCSGSVDWLLEQHPYYPPTVNDGGATSFARAVAGELLGEANVLDTEPIMPGEDFAFFTRAVPSAFLFIGIRNESAGSIANLHSPDFKVDEAVLPIGAAVHASLAMQYLARQQEGFGGRKAAAAGGRDEL